MSRYICISFKNWDNRIKSIQTKSMKKYGCCRITAVDMLMNKCVIESQPDEKIVVIDEALYKSNRAIALSEDFQKQWFKNRR